MCRQQKLTTSSALDPYPLPAGCGRHQEISRLLFHNLQLGMRARGLNLVDFDAHETPEVLHVCASS